MSEQLASIRAGHFARQVPPAALLQWRKRWPDHKDPSQLFPGNSANQVYIGVEMIPCVWWNTTRGRREVAARPAGPRLRFTREQHIAVAELAFDIAMRYSWPDRWWKSGRLVGHEDLSLLTRSHAAGGWDPGALRTEPYWSWDLCLSHLRPMLAPEPPRGVA